VKLSLLSWHVVVLHFVKRAGGRGGFKIVVPTGTGCFKTAVWGC